MPGALVEEAVQAPAKKRGAVACRDDYGDVAGGKRKHLGLPRQVKDFMAIYEFIFRYRGYRETRSYFFF